MHYNFIDKRRITIQENLEYCSKNIEFYRGKTPNIDDFDFIDKNVVRGNFDKFICKGFHIKNVGHTSGTTGTPGKYYRDIKSMAMEQYFQSKYFNWDGKYTVILRGEHFLSKAKEPKKIYKNLPLLKQMYVSSYHMNDMTMEKLVEKLSGIKNKCLWAYPSAAYLLADYCRRKNKELTFDIVATSSEMLLENQVMIIEDTFKCKIKDWYGQGERVAAFYRCEYGHYHEVEGYSFVEYDKIEGNIYEVIGTTLNNRVMPLVRFRTGDLVEISDESCKCRNKGVNISTIIGRSNDYIELPDRKMTGTVLAMPFKNSRNIVEAQVIQKKDKSIIVKVVKNEKFNTEDEKRLFKEIYNYLPKDMCEIQFVEEIQKNSNGKFRFVINESV